MMKRIDTHQHFWVYSAEDYAWIDDSMAGLKRNFLPDDLHPLLKQKRISATIAVQARQALQETNWLLSLTEDYAWIAGVVGWVDLCSPDCSEQLRSLSTHPRLVGVRHVLHDEQDERFCLREEFIAGIAQLESYNLSYDVLIKPPHLPHAITMMKQFPNQRFIIDHIAKPLIRERVLEPWKSLITEAASVSNVWCKVSGMVTEADWEKWSYGELQPYMDVVLEAFGAERLLAGSDWPVCTCCGEYDTVMNVPDTFLDSLPHEEQSRIWCQNPREAYPRLQV